MTLHDRIARARTLFSGAGSAAIPGRHPAAPNSKPAAQPAPASLVAHHPSHLDRRTARTTRPVANHHPHHKTD